MVDIGLRSAWRSSSTGSSHDILVGLVAKRVTDKREPDRMSVGTGPIDSLGEPNSIRPTGRKTMAVEAPGRAGSWAIAAALIGGIASLAVPAPAAPLTVAEIANHAGNDRQRLLENGAKAEAALTIYTTGTQIAPLVDRFKQKYPFVRVQMLRASSIEVATKVTQEYSAGVFLVDAFELNSDGLILPRDQGVLQPFTSPEAANFEAHAVEGGRHWISVRESYTGIGFNTAKIPVALAPKTYQDLLDPRWKGKMAISATTGTVGNWVGAMMVTYGADFVRMLGKQDIRLYPVAGRALANLMIAGEVALSPTIYQSHVAASRVQGAPLAWNAPGPVPVTDTAVALAAKAPHPHAAMLFIDFLLSREAQLLYRDLGYLSSRKDMKSDEYPDLQKLFLMNRPNYVEEFDAWMGLYQEAFAKSARR
jgi:iron(III) transport system substrate-binding protein